MPKPSDEDDDIMADVRRRLLPQAIEEQKKNERIRRISWWMIVGGGIYLVIFAIVSLYIKKKYGVQIPPESIWEMLIILPAALAFTIGFLGIIISKGNGVMELTKVGDTYIPKSR